MKAPSVKTLVSTFRDLTEAKAGLIKRICRAIGDGEALADAVRECGSVPDVDPYDVVRANKMWQVTYALRAIDHLMGTYGVEALVSRNDSIYSGPRYEYLNTGNTYAATLIYYRDSGTLRIGCMGDIIERDRSID